MIIAIDFDGTVVEHRFPEIGEELPGAIETIRALQAAGHELVLWTCREGTHLFDACRWLSERGVDEFNFKVNDNRSSAVAAFGGRNPRKVYADVYIDDRNLGGFPGWAAVREALLG